MKGETNNQIDLLLRRMGRADGDVARDAQTAADDRHLDADELSSYAQNALPEAARLRYTEHLAECATCRKIVGELSVSLGAVAAAAPVETVPAPGGFRMFLASLFSPLVLRYAVPALGVIVVMIVGFVVLRQQRQPELARTMNKQVEEPESITGASPTPTFNDGKSQTPEQVPSRGNVEPKSKPASVAAESAGGAGSAPAAAAGSGKDERAVDEVQPSATPPPPAPAKVAEPIEAQAPATTTGTVAKKQPEVAKAKADAEGAKPAGGTFTIAQQKAAKDAEENKSKATSSETSGFVGGLGGSRNRATTRRTAEATREDEKRAERDQANEEIRTIAGRRFRKERGIWTDTAYDSSTATVDMARDSEQFRALVADEPGIGTIARQLDGEVIVVWKGRAYRIR